jgi:hypothetical protein
MTVPVEIGLKTLLLASAPVAALIVDRFAPILQSQGTERPFIVYSRVASDPQHHLGGFSGLSFSRFQLDLFADTAVALYNLREAVRTASMATRARWPLAPTRSSSSASSWSTSSRAARRRTTALTKPPNASAWTSASPPSNPSRP